MLNIDFQGNNARLSFSINHVGNIAYKLLNRVGGTGVIGPILLGLDKPINILQRDDEVDQIIDIIAITAMEAQKY